MKDQADSYNADVESVREAKELPRYIPQWVVRQRNIQIITIGAVALFIAPLFLFRGSLDALSQFGYIGVFLASFAGSASILLPVPGIAVVLTGGYLWNPFLVGIVGGMGMTLGEISGYALGFGSRDLLEKYRRLRFLERWMARRGGLIIFFGSLIPNPFFDVLGFIAGSQRYPLGRFFLWALPGKTIRALAIAYLGSYGLDSMLRFFGLA